VELSTFPSTQLFWILFANGGLLYALVTLKAIDLPSIEIGNPDVEKASMSEA
jgi:hypothetical protein